jgi:hypothetical protein
MRNKYILLEMNKKNEIRADIDISIASLGLFGLENVNVKIDTGCPYTSIPIKKLGISSEKALEWKKRDIEDNNIQKQISYGVNDTDEQKEQYREMLKQGKYEELPAVTFLHRGLTMNFDGVEIKSSSVNVSYDRTGNILIGMDILRNWDIHIGTTKYGKTVLLACPKDQLNDEYFLELNNLFELGDDILGAVCYPTGDKDI